MISLFKNDAIMYNTFGGVQMSIRFSRVTAMTTEKAAIFLVGGIPGSQEDLDGWTAFQDFTADLNENTVITVSVETFEYGEGEQCDATPEEIAYFYFREERRPDFIESRANKIGESSFVLWLNK